MKLFTIILFLSSSFSLMGQFGSSLEIIIGTDFTHRIINSSSSILSRERINSEESGAFTIRYGLGYNVKLRERLWFKTSIIKSSIGQRVKYQYNQIQFIDTGSLDTIPQNLPSSDLLKVDYTIYNSFVEMPILIRKEFSEKTFSFFMEFGLSPIIYINTKTKGTINEISLNSRRRSLKPLNVASIFSAGFNFSISENFILFSQTTGSIYLFNSSKSNIKRYFYSLGLEIGIRKYLN